MKVDKLESGGLPLVCRDKSLQRDIKGLEATVRNNDRFMFDMILAMIDIDLLAAGHARLSEL